MFDENLSKRIENLKTWDNAQKHYIINRLYYQKIKDYLLQEYEGEILSDPILGCEYCSDILDNEEYSSVLHFHVHFKDKTLPITSCISFHVTYKYTVSKKDSSLWEVFQAYRKSDEVYLQGAGEYEYPKVYREEYTRAWQEGGFSKIPTYPEFKK